MSPISTRRLLRMSGDELMWRARQAGRTAAQRVAVGVRPPRWRREELYEIVADGVLDNACPATDDDASWQAVHVELSRRIAQRTSRFALDPTSARPIQDTVNRRWPNAAAEAIARADSVVAGRYDLLGYRQLAWSSSDTVVDWHLDPVANRTAPRRFWADVPYLDPATGDHKVIWELNRHQHWLQLGRALWLTSDLRYRQCTIQQLGSWLSANPPLVGINWASMLEIALRAISWMWGLHFLLPFESIGDSGSGVRDPWLVDMLVALNRQLTHVEENLSVYFSPNTHLTGEALGLYVVGVALPELAGSSRWMDTGRSILIEEIGRQIHPDGGHVERSTHYQRYTLDFYLMALLTAQRDNDLEAVAIFADAVRRLAEYTRTMADDAGQLPLIGDDDGGMLWPITGRRCHDVRDSLSVAAALLVCPGLAPWGLQEEAVWIAGPRACNPEPSAETAPQSLSIPQSRVLEDTGFVVFRDAAGSHATFDVRERHYSSGGHEHAAALSITLGLHGQPLLIDPGTSTYTMDPRLRDLLRSTASHNTLTIDDRPQAIPRGPFHWHASAAAHLTGSRFNERFGWAEASHDGYAPIHHRRTIVKTVRGDWLIADEILGSGRTTARAHWHFDPRWTVRHEAPGCILAAQPDGMGAWLLHDGDDVLVAHGDEASGLGWYAPVYGTLIPAWTVRTTRQSHAPYSLLSCVRERNHVAAEPPLFERVEPVAEAGGMALGARLVDTTGSSVFLVWPGDSRARETRACKILEYQTDARVFHYEEISGRLAMIDIVDASHALAVRPDWLSVVADEVMSNLHVSVCDGMLDLRSSDPPQQLRLQGGPIYDVRCTRLNGRVIEAPSPSHTDGLVIRRSDWAAAAPPVLEACGQSLSGAAAEPERFAPQA